MGFSIGRFLGKVAGPILGGILGGPLGAVVGAGVTAGFAKPAPIPGRQLPAAVTPIRVEEPIGTSLVPTPGAVSQVIQLGGNGRGFGTGGFGLARRRVGFVGGAARAVAPFFGAGATAGFALSEILNSARQATGQRVTKNKIIDAAKHCGIELAADTFGLSETDVCKVIVAGRTRRRRGISAADVRRTKRTLRFVGRIKKDLKAVRL